MSLLIRGDYTDSRAAPRHRPSAVATRAVASGMPDRAGRSDSGADGGVRSVAPVVAGEQGRQGRDIRVGPAGEAVGEGLAAAALGLTRDDPTGLGGVQEVIAPVAGVDLAGEVAEPLERADLSADGRLVEQELFGQIDGLTPAALQDQVEDAVGDRTQLGVQFGGAATGASPIIRACRWSSPM